MTETAPRKPRTLAVHPNHRGFGWITFEGIAPYDWGTVGAWKDKNAFCLAKVEKLIGRFSPETLVLEAFERRNSARSDRIARLCRAIEGFAVNQGVEVAIYTRGDIRATFASVGAKSRDEIAAAVALHIEALRTSLPRARRPWDREQWRIAVFCAAALVLTHRCLEAGRLLGGLDLAV